MEKLRFLKCGLTALMMAFAMTLCYSCSSDDDEETPEEKKESKEGEKEKEFMEKDNPSSNVKGNINGHTYVLLAGYKWATENVGKVDGVKAAATHLIYGYCYSKDNAITAAQSWGGTWKLSTTTHWMALMDKCYWEWTNDYSGKTGYIVYEAKKDEDKGKVDKEGSGYSPSTDLHIFLLAAGICHDDGRSVVDGQGFYGYYWAADNFMTYLRFFNGDRYLNDYHRPSYGMAVRPVSE